MNNLNNNLFNTIYQISVFPVDLPLKFYKYYNNKTVGLPNINLKNYLIKNYLIIDYSIKFYIVPDVHYNILGIGKRYIISSNPNYFCNYFSL